MDIRYIIKTDNKYTNQSMGNNNIARKIVCITLPYHMVRSIVKENRAETTFCSVFFITNELTPL